MALNVKSVLRDAHTAAQLGNDGASIALLSVATFMRDSGIDDIAENDESAATSQVMASTAENPVDVIARALRGLKFTAAESDRLIDIILSRAVVATE
jgi:hypothetical protein